MKQIKIAFALLCMAFVAASCNKEFEADAPETPADMAQLIKIAPFPAFDQGAQTRAIGNEDAGKTTWENGDQVLLAITPTGTTTTSCFVLTYNLANTAWDSDKPIDFNLTDYRNTATITAYYAPHYEWSTATAGELALKSGKQAGMDEYITYTATSVNLKEGIIIDFSGARPYSRLRIAAASDMTVTLTAANFTAIGTATALGDAGTITTTADSKGNAYFYGSWTASASLAVALEEDGTAFANVSKTVTNASTTGSSYAIDGLKSLTGYNDKGYGTQVSPFRIYNATQLRDFSANCPVNHPSANIKLMNDIDLTGDNWAPIENFASTLDGNFHTIKGMTINDNSTDGTGFVRVITSTGGIKNLIIKQATINNEIERCYAAALVGFSNFGTITNCHILNSEITAPTATLIGGLVCINDGNLIGCSVINTTLTSSSGNGTIGGLVTQSKATSVTKGCIFYGSLYVDDGNKDFWSLATTNNASGSIFSSVYCQNTFPDGTKLLWAPMLENTGTKTDCAYVDGTTITWATAITKMNAAIKNDITGYEYVYDATLSCPKMVKK